MPDRWSEHPVRPAPALCPASLALAVVTVLVAIAAQFTPLVVDVGLWSREGL